MYRLDETVLMARASWPSTICSVALLHAWDARLAALVCTWCGEHILYEDCRAYQLFERYWRMTMANPDARLN